MEVVKEQGESDGELKDRIDFVVSKENRDSIDIDNNSPKENLLLDISLQKAVFMGQPQKKTSRVK